MIYNSRSVFNYILHSISTLLQTGLKALIVQLLCWFTTQPEDQSTPTH